MLTYLFWFLTLTVLLTYLAFGGYLYLNQRKVLYQPNPAHQFSDCPDFTEAEKVDFHGTRFYHWQHPSTVPQKLIVFYHGNASSACDHAFLKPLFTRLGFSYLFAEYPGYAGDPQAPTKDLILRSVQHINQFIQQKSYQNVIVIGESLGSGPAAYHTRLAPVAKLLLISAYSSIVDVAAHQYPIYPVKILITDNFQPLNWLQNYQNPILIIHGGRDQVLPLSLSEKLHNSLPNPQKRLLVIPNGDHNPYKFPEVIDNIQAFLR